MSNRARVVVMIGGEGITMRKKRKRYERKKKETKSRSERK
jgi:hypothetical protein